MQIGLLSKLTKPVRIRSFVQWTKQYAVSKISRRGFVWKRPKLREGARDELTFTGGKEKISQ